MLERSQLTGRVAAAALLAGLACGASAQVFRIVGPDGKVTFSDKPPAETGGKATPAPTVPMPGGAAAASTGGLPFEVRQAATKFPVTLYTGRDCGPCGTGRSFLSGRGIPFTEKTVTSNDDAEAFKRLTGASTVPVLTIGSQQLLGFSQSEWAQYLDAAGYPKTSQLPPGYARPAPTPLVAVQEAARKPPTSAGTTTATPTLPPPPPPSGGNPAGIQF
ncbi:MAG TPA: glutaredoxin family protein [Ramlibacter sp.]|jgi:glutaredoxin|uniref:glutaredoxin family protein n=1 Tax=Ramlibacter sp. TaxID=1917967 RepID=UPI002D4F91CE|nr:glutaredoxin family protein [Ramlibacter sp.]HZY18693.1 glutaredoxin family protein [Ramlibacter sp.]